MKTKFFKTNGEVFELREGGRIIVYDDSGNPLLVLGQDTPNHIWMLDGNDVAFKEELKAIDSGVRIPKLITHEVKQ